MATYLHLYQSRALCYFIMWLQISVTYLGNSFSFNSSSAINKQLQSLTGPGISAPSCDLSLSGKDSSGIHLVMIGAEKEANNFGTPRNHARQKQMFRFYAKLHNYTSHYINPKSVAEKNSFYVPCAGNMLICIKPMVILCK